MRPLSDDWKPPVCYPAVMSVVDGRVSLTFPDFATSVLVPGGEREVLSVGRAWVKRWLRERAATRKLSPFASNPDKLEGPVILVPTEGWERIEEEDTADD